MNPVECMKPSDDSMVIVNHYRHLADRGELPSWMPTYRGLPIHSLPEKHERVGELLEASLPKGSHILDLAAGAGALSLRMQDLGYKVTACDYVKENFRLHETVPFQRVNLNETFANQFEEKFDAIVASEILEHIENPRHVLRQCARLLKNEGLLLATTPNIESSFSIAMRLRNGYFPLFDDAYYRRDGHITPITRLVLSQALDEAGFSIETFETAGAFYPAPWWKLRLLIKAIDALRVDKNIARGASLIVVARLHTENA